MRKLGKAGKKIAKRLANFDFRSSLHNYLSDFHDLNLQRNNLNDWSPDVHVKEYRDHLRISADLPGLRKEDIRLNLDNHLLSIEGERSEEHRQFVRRYIYEKKYGKFTRCFYLPPHMDLDTLKAKFRDGVLDITIYKAAGEEQEGDSKLIEIEEAGQEDSQGYRSTRNSEFKPGEFSMNPELKTDEQPHETNSAGMETVSPLWDKVGKTSSEEQAQFFGREKVDYKDYKDKRLEEPSKGDENGVGRDDQTIGRASASKYNETFNGTGGHKSHAKGGTITRSYSTEISSPTSPLSDPLNPKDSKTYQRQSDNERTFESAKTPGSSRKYQNHEKETYEGLLHTFDSQQSPGKTSNSRSNPSLGTANPTPYNETFGHHVGNRGPKGTQKRTYSSSRPREPRPFSSGTLSPTSGHNNPFSRGEGEQDKSSRREETRETVFESSDITRSGANPDYLNKGVTSEVGVTTSTENPQKDHSYDPNNPLKVAGKTSLNSAQQPVNEEELRELQEQAENKGDRD